MNSDRSNPVAWLLLMVFSVQVLVPQLGWALELCIGCEKTGFAFGPAVSRLCSDSACYPALSETPADGPLSGYARTTDELAATCDCVHIELKYEYAPFTVPQSRSDGQVPEAVLPWPPHTWSPAPLRGPVCQRGPPEQPKSSGDQSLFGQRTSLTI